MICTAILGFAHGHVMGFGAEWIHHPEYGVKLVKGWDADAQRAEKCCEQMKIAQAQSLEEILADTGIEAVVIASETVYHAELAVKAANAGKKIILYKPMALTLAQADEIVTAVETNGVDFTMAWQMRTDPVNEEIRRLLSSGELGRPFYFRRRHCLNVHTSPDFRNTWHVKPELNRDIFSDDSAHPIDWMLSLFGMPQSVMCELTTAHIPEIPNDLGIALFKYPNGLICEVSFCAVASAAELTTEIYCEKGTIQHYGGDGPSTRLPHENMTALKWFREGDSDWTVSDIPVVQGQWVRICAQAQPLGEFLNGSRVPICTAAQGRDALTAVLKCYESASSGERVYFA